MTGVMDRCEFKVKYGGEEISHDCMEPVLSSFHFSNKKKWQRTQNFSACLKSKWHSILLSTLNLHLGDHLQAHSLLWSSLAPPSLTICYNFSFNLLHILVIQCYEDHTRNH